MLHFRTHIFKCGFEKEKWLFLVSINLMMILSKQYLVNKAFNDLHFHLPFLVMFNEIIIIYHRPLHLPKKHDHKNVNIEQFGLFCCSAAKILLIKVHISVQIKTIQIITSTNDMQEHLLILNLADVNQNVLVFNVI